MAVRLYLAGKQQHPKLLLHHACISAPLSLFGLLSSGGVPAKCKAGPVPSWSWLPYSILMKGFYLVVVWLWCTGVGLFLLSLLYPVSPASSRTAASTTTLSAQVWMKWDGCKTICPRLTWYVLLRFTAASMPVPVERIKSCSLTCQMGVGAMCNQEYFQQKQFANLFLEHW